MDGSGAMACGVREANGRGGEVVIANESHQKIMEEAPSVALDAELARPGVSILHVTIETRRNEARYRACLATVCEGIDAELAT